MRLQLTRLMSSAVATGTSRMRPILGAAESHITPSLTEVTSRAAREARMNQLTAHGVGAIKWVARGTTESHAVPIKVRIA